jgi:hypothetical protein
VTAAPPSRGNGVVGWLFLAMFTLALGVGGAFFWLGYDTTCEAARGDSNYGRAGWSWWLPGPTCVWTKDVNGFDGVRAATPWWSVWAITTVVLMVILWRWGRKEFSRR